MGGAEREASARAGDVWFTGRSNVRRFTCRARRVATDAPLLDGAALTAVLHGDSAPTRAAVRVDAARLDCGIGRMNAHLRETLHAGTYPTIEFRLARVTRTHGDSAVRLDGVLSIAGHEKPIGVDATVRDATGDAVRVRGAYTLNVRDYGLVPPRRFAGLLRVRDSVTVHFDVAAGR